MLSCKRLRPEKAFRYTVINNKSTAFEHKTLHLSAVEKKKTAQVTSFTGGAQYYQVDQSQGNSREKITVISY